jgi:hypothetical protein
MLVALLALFAALGGPAQAARLLTGKDIKNHSLSTKELTKKTVKKLRATPRGSVKEHQLANGAMTSAKIANGAVTTGKIAPSSIDGLRLTPNAIGARELMSGAVGNAQIADGAITGAKVADGSLDTREFTRYAGRFSVSVPGIAPATCWSAEPVGLPPERDGADIRGDLVVATPDENWPANKLTFTVSNSRTQSRFVLSACNVATNGDPVGVANLGIRYAIFDLP